MEKDEVGLAMKSVLEMEIRLADEYIASFSKKITAIGASINDNQPMSLADKLGQKLVDMLNENLKKFIAKQQKKQEQIFSSKNLQKFVDDVEYTRKNSAKFHIVTAELAGQASGYCPQVEKEFLQYLISQNKFNKQIFERQLDFVNNNFHLNLGV